MTKLSLKTAAAALCLAALLFSATAMRPAAPAAPAAPKSYVGKVTGWAVKADGTVGFKLEGMRRNRAFGLWFISPADRTETTRFEDLLLDAVMLSHERGYEVTVISDTANEISGKDFENALPVAVIHRG